MLYALKCVPQLHFHTFKKIIRSSTIWIVSDILVPTWNVLNHNFYFPVLSSSHPYRLSGLSIFLLLGHVHPSQLLHRKLRLIDDDEVARVVCLVVLRSGVCDVKLS